MDNARRKFMMNSSLALLGAHSLANHSFGAEYGKEYEEGFKSAGSDEVLDDISRKQPPTMVTIFLRGGADALQALVPYGDPMSVHPVSTYVNRPANDSPRCIEVAA